MDSPAVSIIVPVCNNEDQIEATMASCLDQTLKSLEIICIDDASIDRTPEIVECFQLKDPRIRLLRQSENCSPFQARRQGVLAAHAPYTLFLDGDDSLAPTAAERTLEIARANNSDLLGFGVEVFTHAGDRDSSFEARLRPRYEVLEGDRVLAGLFPPGSPAQMQVWRFLYRTQLLRFAYSKFSPNLRLYRADDLPITFISAAVSTRYSSVSDPLYRYHFQRGGSGQRVENIEQFEFYLGSIDALEPMVPVVQELMGRPDADQESLIASFDTARLTVIGNLLKYLPPAEEGDLAARCLALLHERVSERNTVRAAALIHRILLRAPGTVDQ